MQPDQPSPEPARSGRTSGDTGTGPPLPLRFSKRQLVLAFAIAALSDALGAFVSLAPPAVWAVDVVTVALLFAVLGWQWLLLPGLVMEAIPGVGILPFWILVVVGIIVWGTARPKLLARK